MSIKMCRKKIIRICPKCGTYMKEIRYPDFTHRYICQNVRCENSKM